MNIYFSGIGGVAIGPLSEIALDAGYSVQGSDSSSSLVTERLEKRGISLSIGDQDGSFLRACHDTQPIDWFVYTAALPADHPELLLARELGIKTAKRDELIAHIIQEKNLKLIAVAGTHGKTTTTGMLIWALQEHGVPASYSVGTTLSWGPSGMYDPKSEYFVYECDEFDRNFLHFLPFLSLITSVEYDHPDTYPTERDYMSAFRQFVHQSELCILWQIDADRMATRDPSTWSLQEDEVIGLPLSGEHNRRNATLVLKVLEHLRIGENITNRDTIATFPGTNRRFERLADNLYTDYGHTPTEITATLQMAKEVSDKVALVYQPHQNVRQHQIKHQYIPEVFSDADKVYWLPTYLSRENQVLPILTPQELTAQLPKESTHIVDLDDDLWQVVAQLRRDGYLVLLMGAGAVDTWARQQLRT